MATSSAVPISRPAGVFWVPDNIFETQELSQAGLIVYMYLCRRANACGMSHPSYERIAKDCRMHRNTAIKTVKALQRLGLVKVEARYAATGQRENTYFVERPRLHSPDRPAPVAPVTTPLEKAPIPLRSQSIQTTPPVHQECPNKKDKEAEGHNNSGLKSVPDTGRPGVTTPIDPVVVEKLRTTFKASTGADLLPAVARRLVQQYGPTGCFEQLKLLQKAKKVRNPIGWLTAALSQGWMDTQRDLEARRLKRQLAAEEKEAAERAQEVRQRAEEAKLLEAYAHLSESEKWSVDRAVDTEMQSVLGSAFQVIGPAARRGFLVAELRGRMVLGAV